MGRSRIAHAATIICTILIVGLSSYTGYANDKIIKVGIPQNPPLAYKDSDGTLKGLSVDVIEYIAAIEGWRLQYIHCPWSKCLEMLESGETDLQIVIAYSKERAKKYDFTRETLFSNWGQVFVRSGSKIVSLLDLEGKKISFVAKNIHAIAFKELIHGLGINCKLIGVAYNKSAFKLVNEREADAVVSNRTYGELNAKGYGLEKTSIIFNPVEIRMAVLKDRNQDILNTIDRHLKALKENKSSIYHQTLANLFGSVVRTETPRWVKWSLASGATIIILFALIVAILRYRINQKAKEIAERKKAEEQIQASLKEKEVLLKEIHHRVKNNMQIMVSLLRLQSEGIKDKHLLGLFEESRNRIKSMALIHEDLYSGKDLGRIDFDHYTRTLIARLMKSFGVDPNRIMTSINIDNVFLGVDTAIPCGLILNELFTNSLKYAFPLDRFKDKKGEIRIDCHSNSAEHILVFSDNGVGLPEDIDFQDPETMGLDLVKTLTQQLGGTIELNRNNGTEFTITFKV